MQRSEGCSPFRQAVASKKGRTGLLVCAVSLLVVFGLVALRRLAAFSVPPFVMIVPGFCSMMGMQMFANEANRLRMEQEKQGQDSADHS